MNPLANYFMVIINAVKIISERMNIYWNLFFQCQLSNFFKRKERQEERKAEGRKTKRKKEWMNK